MLYTAFIFGLISSFHCLGMCGPIAFILPVSKTSKLFKTIQISAYHIGRLISYMLLGLIFGFIGKGLYLSGLQQRVSIVIGILIILYAITPIHLLNKFQVSKPIYIGISKLKNLLGKSIRKKSLVALLSIGLLNGLLPCGMVYMALFGAIATGKTIDGSLYMTFFGLGTIPLMTTAVYFGNLLNITIRNKIQKAIPLFISIIGVLFILRGLGLGIPYVSPSSASLDVGSSIITECKNIIAID